MAEKPRLLYVVEAMGGGIFSYLVDLTNALAEHFDISIAYAVRSQTPEDYRAYFDRRIRLIPVENFTRAVDPLRDIRAFFELRRIGESVRPDIVHLHSSKAGALGRWAFNGRRLPLFYTPHGYSFLMRDCSRVKCAAFRAIEWLCARRACTTVSCSPGEHEESLKLTKNAVYINNGINIRTLQTVMDSTPREEHPFTVFTLGRICYQKNPALFNAVAQALPAARFVWIGDGELRGELRSENIRVTGWVDRQQAIRCAVNGDVFLLTSLWEGLPISLLEAMYMEKLCVVSDVIGNRDVIRSGCNGFVCRSAGEFADAIMSRDASCARRARQDVCEAYNTGVMAQRYWALYRRALARRAGAPRE